MWLRRWFWVGGGISLLGGLLWLLVEHDLGLHALVRSAGWAIVVWVGCGLIWIGLQYGQEYEESPAYLRLRSEHRADGYGPLLRVRHSYVPGGCSSAVVARRFITLAASGPGMPATAP